jgi:rubrerythrin
MALRYDRYSTPRTLDTPAPVIHGNRVVAIVTIPLARAYICPACESISDATYQGRCPSCTSTSMVPLASWLGSAR